VTDTPKDSRPIPADKQLIDLFVGHLIRALSTDGEIPAATLEVIRKVCQDNAITISSVRRGDFGTVAKAAAEDFPFNDDGSQRGETIMGAKSH